MKLTKKKALEIAIELWTDLAENPGMEKHEWHGWEKYGEMDNECPFCERSTRHPREPACSGCPLEKDFDGCYASAFGRWIETIDGEDGGHTAAVEFLAQLKALK